MRTTLATANYKKLWENSNPTSSFAAQTLTLTGMSDYSYVLIWCETYTAKGTQIYDYHETFTIVRQGCKGIVSSFGEEGSYATQRGFYVNGDKLQIEVGKYAGTYGGLLFNTNNCLVPMWVIGMDI